MPDEVGWDAVKRGLVPATSAEQPDQRGPWMIPVCKDCGQTAGFGRCGVVCVCEEITVVSEQALQAERKERAKDRAERSEWKQRATERHVALQAEQERSRGLRASILIALSEHGTYNDLVARLTALSQEQVGGERDG